MKVERDWRRVQIQSDLTHPTHDATTYLPALVPRSVVGKVVPDPTVDLAEGHLLAGVAHGQANEGGVGVERLPLAVPLVVHLERHAAVVLEQLVHVDLLVWQ